MNVDIGGILDAWPYEANRNVRHIRSEDGREKLQVRVEQGPFRGVLQMDLEGRPDGVRPHGHDFALDYYAGCRDQAEAAGEAPFRLDREMCRELFAESACIYERYAFLLQLADFERVVRDTERNMRLFRFVHRHAEHPDDRDNLERWWPYLLRINGTARAMLALRRKGARQALRVAASVRRRIEALPVVDAVEFRLELTRSREALDELEAELTRQVEPSPRERLESELAAAIASERFEAAAGLRDRLRQLDDEAATASPAGAEPGG